MNAITARLKALRKMSKPEVIAAFPSRLSKGHLASESKGDLINSILCAEFSRKDLDAWMAAK